MVPEGQSEEAAVSASEPVELSGPAVTPEAAESAEDLIAASTGINWADASDEATADIAGTDPADFPELAEGTAEDPLAQSAPPNNLLKKRLDLTLFHS